MCMYVCIYLSIYGCVYSRHLGRLQAQHKRMRGVLDVCSSSVCAAYAVNCSSIYICIYMYIHTYIYMRVRMRVRMRSVCG